MLAEKTVFSSLYPSFMNVSIATRRALRSLCLGGGVFLLGAAGAAPTVQAQAELPASEGEQGSEIPPVPVPELVEGRVLVETDGPWSVWFHTSEPPGWPDVGASVPTRSLDESPSALWQGAPDRVVVMNESSGQALVEPTWWTGAMAPFWARPMGMQVALEPSNLRLLGRRINRGTPPPSRTTLVFYSPQTSLAVDEETQSILWPGEAEATTPSWWPSLPVGAQLDTESWRWEVGEERWDDAHLDPSNLYFFRRFDVDEVDSLEALQLELQYGGGAVVYLNGREVARANVPAGREGFGQWASLMELPEWVNSTMNDRWQWTFMGLDPSLLVEGENTLSVAVYRRPDSNRKAMAFDLELRAYDERGFTKTPYLQDLGQTEVTVMWELNVAGQGLVEIEEVETGRRWRVQGPSPSGTHHEVVVNGLQASHHYRYQVRGTYLDGEVWESEPMSFRSAVGEGEPFVFVAYGDNRTRGDVHAALVQRMWDDANRMDAGFILSTGDLVTRGSPWQEWQDEFFIPALPLMSSFAYYTALGNHEGNHEAYYHYLSLPGNESWYSFRWGMAEFFAVNSSHDYEPGSTQHEWLSNALENSVAPWKIVFFHHPPYPCTPSRKPGDIGVQTHLVPLFEEHDVQLVLLGHDHLYGRSRDMNGVRYIISGGGGAPQYRGEVDAVNEICESVVHYCTVQVERDTLRLRAVSTDGVVIDTLDIPRDGSENAL